MNGERVKEVVKENYAKIAREDSSCCVRSKPTCGGADTALTISKNIGYSEEELKGAPNGANLGLGCGNPVALAALNAGDIVVDLGSGAGLDCFLAADKVGEKGQVIGVDMTPAMVEKARENSRKGNYQNVEFRLGEIEKIPVDSAFVDVVISNCVINLSPDKDSVFKEAFRIIKPGGRLMVSDIVLLRELPDIIRNSIEAYVGCLAGAIHKEEYIHAVKDAGFEDIKIIGENHFPAGYFIHDPTAKAIIDKLKISFSELQEIGNSVVSIKVSAVKPVLGN